MRKNRYRGQTASGYIKKEPGCGWTLFVVYGGPKILSALYLVVKKDERRHLRYELKKGRSDLDSECYPATCAQLFPVTIRQREHFDS